MIWQVFSKQIWNLKEMQSKVYLINWDLYSDEYHKTLSNWTEWTSDVTSGAGIKQFLTPDSAPSLLL